MKARWRTAVLVATLSIALAEVSIASSPWGLLFPLAWFLLVPVYGLQVLLLATIVLRSNARPTLTALWCAGLIMGFYEFYITLVLWESTDLDSPSAGLAHWPSLVVIAGFWHAFVSTIAPIILAEQIMAREPRLAGLLPRPMRALGPRARWVVLVLAAVISGGMYGSVQPGFAVPALGGSALVVWGVVVWARRAGPVEDFARDALPNRAGLAWSVGILVVFFGLFILLANTAEPISGPRQLFAVGCYVVASVVLWRNLRHVREVPVTRLALAPVGVNAGVAFVAIAGAAAWIPGVPFVIAIVAIYLGGGAIALGMAASALWGAVRPARPPTTAR